MTAKEDGLWDPIPPPLTGPYADSTSQKQRTQYSGSGRVDQACESQHRRHQRDRHEKQTVEKYLAPRLFQA